MSGYVDDRLGRTQNIIEVRRLDYREGPLMECADCFTGGGSL